MWDPMGILDTWVSTSRPRNLSSQSPSAVTPPQATPAQGGRWGSATPSAAQSYETGEEEEEEEERNGEEKEGQREE